VLWWHVSDCSPEQDLPSGCRSFRFVALKLVYPVAGNAQDIAASVCPRDDITLARIFKLKTKRQGFGTKGA
jgi:hypothetical protein